jgi:hypothetical protein
MESSHLNEALLDERSDGIFGMRVLAGVSRASVVRKCELSALLRSGLASQSQSH